MRVMITNNGGNYVADKTFAEVQAHVQSGRFAYAVYDASQQGYQVEFFPCDLSVKDGIIQFSRLSATKANGQMGNIRREMFSLNSDDTVTWDDAVHSFA